MSDSRKSGTAARHAHPMVGYLVAAPIPAGGEPPTATSGVGVFSILGVAMDDGIAAAIVLEVAELPSGADGDLLTPFSPGDTVFYYERQAIKIAGNHYVAINNLLAWAEADH